MTRTTQVRDGTLYVNLLGEFRLYWGGTAVTTITTPSHQSLLAYLLLNQDKLHTRQQLAFHFWPDSTEVQARTNLRKAIYKLRHELPQAEQFLCLDKQTVQWQPNASFMLDVADFEQLTNTNYQNRQHTALQPSISNLQQAVTRYRGDLLPGHYDDWILIAREKLRHRYLSSLDQLIRHLENDRRYEDAIRYARQLLREDPLREAAYRRLMRLLTLDNDVAGALRIYHSCVTILQRELGVSPSRATQETYEQLLQVETPRTVSLPARVPLVAREQVWTTLQSKWRQVVSQESQVVLLTGEAGIGKTRMAEELTDWARRQGIPTITAVCYAAEGQLPYSPIADWLRTDDIQELLGDVADKWLIECARLLPELIASRPDLTMPGPLIEGWQRQHLFAALAHVIFTARQPLLLFVDDLQWCDQDTLDWLHFLQRFDPQARFLLLGTIRAEEVLPGHPLIPWQQFMQRDGNLTSIHLNRLDAKATKQLANHVRQTPLTAEQAAQLFAETEGNSLFVVEMAQAGFQDSQSENQFNSPTINDLTADNQMASSNLPPKLQAVIEFRLSQLSSQAQAIMNLAAAIGHSFTFDLLKLASGNGEEAVMNGLDELWQRRIVREQGVVGYDFTHDKLRQVAYAGISPARRRSVHGRIITALETLHADNLDKASAQLAAHYEAVQQWQKAIDCYQRAAHVSNRIFAHQETIQYLQRAITLLPCINVAEKQQVELNELLGDVLALTGEHEQARVAFETAVSHITAPIWQSQLYRKIANTWQIQQEYDKAFQNWGMAENLLGNLIETSDATYWREWLWIQIDRLWVLYMTQRTEEMVQLTEQIQPVIEQYALPSQKGIFLLRLVMVKFHRERFVLVDETIRIAQAALAAIEETDYTNQIALTRFSLGMAHLYHGWTGNLDEAEHHMQIALKEAEKIGDIVLQTRCLAYLTLNYRRRGEVDKVKKILPRAQEVAEKAKMVEYVAYNKMSAAWVAWREGNIEQVYEIGQSALETLKSLPLRSPFLGEVLWLLIDVALHQGDIEIAVTYAPMLMDPSQRRLPSEITNWLQKAITAWEANKTELAQNRLQLALQLAQEVNYL